jgi:nitroreductase
MELYEAMRTNPSCRYFTDEPVPNETLHRIFDHARFASSGGNRQGWRTIAIREPEMKAKIAALHQKQWDVYLTHARDGVVG